MDYKSSGVDIDAGNEAVKLIKQRVADTYSSQVLSGVGGFAAHFELPEGYRKPVLVSCTDGVGTKVKLAIESGRLDTVGIDLVAMCVNDLICSGAKPLFFLDYIACHSLVPTQMAQLVSGIADGCEMSGCSLIGGEMAEMGDLYRSGDFDLAGFVVGVVEKDEIIDGSQIAPGQYVYGVPSSGCHSNGYSLVRQVFTPEVRERFDVSVEDLLAPTRIYVPFVLDLLSKTNGIRGIAHITGGGLLENIERILPEGVHLVLNRDALPKQRIFSVMAEAGVAEDELYRVFNMGVGLVIISETKLEDPELILLGSVTAGQKGVSFG